MATKRKRVAFVGVPDDDEGGKSEQPSEKRVRTFKEKHSLDSDEEDKADDAGELGEEDLAYQEKSTIAWDEGQKITPFNLDEEMEEGRFDAHGNYYAKDGEDVADSWLDSVNWDKVKAEEDSEDEQSTATASKSGDGDDEDDDADDSDGQGEDDSGDETYSLLRKAVEILKPGETVAAAMRRLGKSQVRPKFRKGKAPAAPSDGLSAEERAEMKAAFSILTDIADRLVQLGRMSVYEETYEKFSFEIREHENSVMDMAVGGGSESKSKDESQSSDLVSGQAVSDAGIPRQILNAATADSSCSEVCWHVKGSSSSDAQLLGPFSSTQMNEWSESGVFGSNGVMVRKAKDSSGEFYSSKRIDFDLYTD